MPASSRSPRSAARGSVCPRRCGSAATAEKLVVLTPVGSGKVRRLRHDPRVEIRPCGRFGKVADGVAPVAGTAEVRERPADVARARDDDPAGLSGRVPPGARHRAAGGAPARQAAHRAARAADHLIGGCRRSTPRVGRARPIPEQRSARGQRAGIRRRRRPDPGRLRPVDAVRVVPAVHGRRRARSRSSTTPTPTGSRRSTGSKREFDAEITEQHPEERIAWTSTGGEAKHAGVVTFHRLDDAKTRVMIQIDWEPEGLVEKAGAASASTTTRSRPTPSGSRSSSRAAAAETGAWRGDVERPS